MSQRKFPKIYLKFEGKKTVDGKKRLYWIQDATEDLFQEIEDQLIEYFINDEPVTKFIKVKDCPISLAEFRFFYNQILNEKLTLVCLTKDNQNNTKLAGFNLLIINKAGEDLDSIFSQLKGACSKKLLKIFKWIESQRNMLEEFKLPHIVKAMGLYVLLDYRGEGLGEQLLRARELLCRNIGVPATLTAFTSVISQKLAARVGFEDFYCIDYQELGKIDPEMEIPGIQSHTKTMKYMYKLYN